MRADLAGAGKSSRRIVYYLFGRVIIVSVLLGFSAFIQIKGGHSFTSFPLYSIYILVATSSFVSLLHLPFLRRPINKILILFQFGWDSLFVTAMVVLTGGFSSIFTFLYLLLIIVSAIVMGSFHAFFTAIASCMFFIGLTLITNYTSLVPLSYFLKYPETYTTTELFYTLLINISAFFMIAALASYLAEQTRRAGVALKEKEVDLRQMERLNERIIEAMTAGLITSSTSLKIITVNQAAADILGIPVANLTRMSLVDLFPGIGDKLALLQHNRVIRFEETCAIDGVQKNLRLTLSMIDLGVGSFTTGYTLIFEDETELKELQIQKNRNERLAAIGQLSAGLAHEIRNPLSAISGSLQMITRQSNFDKTSARMVEIAMHETERLNHLITDFLNFAKPAIQEFQPINCRDLVGECLALLYQDREICAERKIVNECAEEIYIYGDWERLKQVIWNVIINAIQSTDDNGSVIIRAGYQVSDRFEKDRGPFVEIEIEDNGCGLNEESADKIFDPFFTTKEAGTGLGLSVVYSIIEAHNGLITVSSKPGEGATFKIVLPSADVDQEGR